MRVVAVPEAQREIVAAVAVQPPLRVPLADAIGRIFAGDLHAPFDLPPWTNASMDGYAVRAEDIAGATTDTPRQLQLTDTIAAGTFPAAPLAPGTAARIFTGAAVPTGADSVVRQEDTDRQGDRVLVRRDRDAGANVRVAGGDLARGALALGGGTPIGPHQLALLAALGTAHPVVHRLPRVGVLVTGDEVVALDHPEEIFAGRALADVNGPALAALVRAAGGIPVPLGIAPDDPAALRQLVAAADDIDLLITAGGVSVGDHDHVRDVMSSLGVRLHFDRVRVRPGGPTAFGVFPDGRPWLALPGNPVSAMVTFELFGRPAIRTMAGHRQPFRSSFGVTLDQDVRRDATLDQYLRCALRSDAGASPIATLTGPQGSGMLMSMVRADGLIVVPAGEGIVAAGEPLVGIRFD